MIAEIAGKNSERQIANGRLGTGLALVKKVSRLSGEGEVSGLREGSTGRVLVMLPRVWAVAETQADAETHVSGSGRGSISPRSRPEVEVAFYRKYSEAMLKRYLRMSTESGRVPSLLGREMFRGNVTSYRVHSFEDVVVFCMDVERCLAKLNPQEKDLIRRVALQEYTQAEATAVLGFSLRFVAKEYGAAIDKLTRMFLKARMLEPLKSCQ